MTILMTKQDYNMNRSQIDGCLRGEMCKIMRYHDRETGEVRHIICDDVTEGGWTTADGRKFHPSGYDGTWHYTGLGTFYLIQATPIEDGGCMLWFTDDLNPDMP